MKDSDPTSIANVHLATGCSNTRAGVKIVKKDLLKQPNSDPHH